MSRRKEFLNGTIGVDDWFKHPYFVREQDLLKEWQILIARLKRIPHLPLGIQFDLQRVRAEVSSIKDWFPHKLHPSKGFTQGELSFHEFSFQGQCLTDIQRDSEAGMSDAQYDLFLQEDAQFDADNKLKFFRTKAGDAMPATIEAIQQISPNFNRSRVIRTPPEGGIKWHSHHNGIYSSPYMRLCIVNIPIFTNDQVVHSVRDHRDSNGTIYSLNYKEGEAYIFNSWHSHEFWNRGDADRITIIPYFNFADEKLLEFLQARVELYDGPLLEADD